MQPYRTRAKGFYQRNAWGRVSTPGTRERAASFIQRNIRGTIGRMRANRARRVARRQPPRIDPVSPWRKIARRRHN